MALDPNDPRVQEYIREQQQEEAKTPKKTPSKKPETPKTKPVEYTTGGKSGAFKRKRAGVVLSREEVKAIKQGRRKLRKEMRQRGIKGKDDFELTAGSLGLYFDKKSAFWAWIFSHWIWALAGLLTLFMAVLLVYSTVQQMRGYYTVNLTSGMFKEGFTLSDTADFSTSTTQLFANPAQDVPCISINQIPADIDETDGEHNDLYFAYTYYIRNEGDSTIGYTWSLDLNSESLSASDAVWVMIIEDGEMRFYAKANKETGEAEALPAYSDNSRGYINLPIMELAPDSDQFQIVKQEGNITYWRVVPDEFLSATKVANGVQTEVEPDSIHKYTVVLWLEGDDNDANEDVIGGHLGVEMNFKLTTEGETDSSDIGSSGDNDSGIGTKWKKFWDSIWGGLEF
jgi:hypothetical protein